MKKFYLQFSVLSVLLLIIIFGGCSELPDTDALSETSKVEGRIASDESSDIPKTAGKMEGALVTIIKFQKDGTYRVISNREVTVNSEGRFIIESDLSGISNVIIKAVKGEMTRMAVISSELTSGITVYCQPLSLESTTETEIYIESLKEGNELLYADIAAYIDGASALHIHKNKLKYKDIRAAIKLKTDIENKNVLSSSTGAAAEQWSLVVKYRQSAQAALERDLFHAYTKEAALAAYEVYITAWVNAYVNAGLSECMNGKAIDAAHKLFIKAINNANKELGFIFFKKISEIRARILISALNVQFNILNLSQSEKGGVIYAGAELLTGIKSSVTTEEMISAFEEHHDKIIAYLAPAAGVSASVISELDAEIAKYRLELIASVAASIPASAVLEAYNMFYTQITDKVKAVLNTTDEKTINAAADILILINLNFI